MKKNIALFLVMIFCFLFFGCGKVLKAETPSTSNKQETSVNKKNNSFFELTENTMSSLLVENEQGGGELLPRKYRNNYYQIPTFFAEIIDSDTFMTWEKEYYSNNYADDTNVMVMLAYIKEFDISQEDFEKANLEYARFIDETYSHICLDPQDYADQEMQEIYNVDIIYTFDNDLINEYYLGIDYPFLNEYEYVEAVESGTYKTRTTEFIDIEQMEAEIIAKYGEAEIVPETATLPEETEAIA